MVTAVVEGLHCLASVHCKLRTASWQMNNCLPALFMRILRLQLLLRKCSAQSRTDCRVQLKVQKLKLALVGAG